MNIRGSDLKTLNTEFGADIRVENAEAFQSITASIPVTAASSMSRSHEPLRCGHHSFA